MTFPPYLMIPLACGLLYGFGILALKRAAELGVGVWRTTFLANWAAALLFLPLGLEHGWAPVPLTLYWQPAVGALVFLAGQIFLFLAFTRGDVSVAAPVLGVKVILVALFSSMLLAGQVPLRWWIGAGMSSAAVGLLNFGGTGRHRQTRQTVMLALASASLFALSDVLVQRWAPGWGQGNFFPPLFLAVGMYSFVLLRFSQGGLTGISPRAWRWVAVGALINALTNSGIAITLGVWGNATAVNIVYSTRGLFSVLLVWLTGHWFANEERKAGRAVLLSRLAGATAIIVAIGLVVI